MTPRSFLLISLIAFSTGFDANKPELTQRIGDLRVTLLGTKLLEPEATSDHHLVVIRFRAQSTAKQALCVGFSATLQASFGLQYRGSVSPKDPFRIRELLPGENTEGEYEFFVKNGSDPLRVILRPTAKTQTCNPEKDSFSAIWHTGDELRFDLLSLPETPITAQPIASGESRGSEHAGAHSAVADARACWDVLQGQVNKYEDIPKTAAGISAYVAEHRKKRALDSGGWFISRNGKPALARGKYQGMLIREIAESDPAYLGWMMSLGLPKDTIDVIKSVVPNFQK